MLELDGVRLHNRLFDTYPCIVHAQGLCETRLWSHLIELVSCLPVVESEPLWDLGIITYNSVHVRSGWNYPQKSLGRAEMSMDKFSLDYTVLGAGIKDWKNKYKLLLALDYLRRSSRKYILSLDSSDVLVLGDVGRVLRYFVDCGYRMLFNAEAGGYGDVGPIVSSWRSGPGPFHHLNAGVWIAEREYAIDFLERCCRVPVSELVKSGQIEGRFIDSEQIRVQSVFAESPEASLDSRCEVFQTILGMELV